MYGNTYSKIAKKNKISHGERPELKVLKIKIYFTGSKNNVLPDVNTSLSELLEACIIHDS